MSTDQPSDFTQGYLLYLMAQASAALSDGFHAHLNEKGVAVSTWRILASLHPDKALGIGALSRSCLTKQPTMTRMVDRLVADDLVARDDAAGDRRRVAVRLTEKGRAMADRLIDEAKAHEAAALGGIGPAETAALKTTLRRLMQA